MEWIINILADKTSVCVIMAVIVVALCELIKFPVKRLTGKIQNNEVRKLVNGAIIYPIVFALSLILVWVYCKCYIQSNIDLKMVCIVSGSAVAAYSAIIDQIISPLIKKLRADTADGVITPDEVKGTVVMTKEQIEKLKTALSDKPTEEDKK